MRLAIGAALLLVIGASFGCGGPARGTEILSKSVPADKPYTLADRHDLEIVREQFDALPLADERRETMRRTLAAEYARRIQRGLARGERDVAYEALSALVSMWSARELADTNGHRGLAIYSAQVREIRRVFALSGGDREAALALLVLRVADPARAATYDHELDEIFAFADDLAVAEYGDGAQRSRSIEILQSAIELFPSPYATDRLIELLVTRQKALNERFRQDGADFQLIRAHGHSMLRTSWNIVRACVRANRLGEAPAAMRKVIGLGDSAELRVRVAAALAKDATAETWIQLAAVFRGEDAESSDLGAGFATCEQATRRFPNAADAHICAADFAFDLGASRLAIRHYQLGMRGQPTDLHSATRLATLYQQEIARSAQSERIAEAARWLGQAESLHARRESSGLRPLTPGLAEAYAAMARGLIGLGELSQARALVARSLEHRPTLAAHELTGTIALRQERFDEAVAALERASLIEPEAIEQRFDRNRILRLLGEAHLGAGDREAATVQFRRAIVSWTQLRRSHRLSRAGLAEAEIERGKLLWHLGESRRATEALERAIDLDPDGASTHTEAVAFLLVHGEYGRALDAYHRALGSPKILDSFKVYMSLWILAEGRRQGELQDQLAIEFLTGRDGELWYDHLARFASGRLALEPLRARADTRGQRAELLYYTAVLSEKRDSDDARIRGLLERVLETDMVLFFEYEMARRWLKRQADASPSAN